ncbi:MAG: outer membrane beta-barrel protein, partial [Gammaproteobacteria bacterium]|nr:outer membrane beta-barrel protein [Gammaproteobacteria bacterium]
LINEQITYDITVSNAGPSDDTGVILTVVLPAMTTFDSVTVDQGSCEVDMGTVTCTIGDLAAGDSVAAQVLVTGPSEAMLLTLSAGVDGDIADPSVANNSASQDVAVIDVIDLIIQGKSKGDGGAFGWIELLLLGAAAGLVALTVRGQRKARHTCASLAAFIGFVAAAALISADDARAQNEWYVGLSAGTTSLGYNAADLTSDLSSLGWTINNASVDDSSDAWKFYVGHQMNDWFAFEAGYVDLGEVITEFGATIPPNQIDALLSDTLSVHPYQGDGWIFAGVGRLEIVAEQFYVVGRAGLFAWDSKTEVRVIEGGTGSVAGDDSGTDSVFGIGLEWQFNPQWSLTVDWERYKLNESLDVSSLGIKFRF